MRKAGVLTTAALLIGLQPISAQAEILFDCIADVRFGKSFYEKMSFRIDDESALWRYNEDLNEYEEFVPECIVGPRVIRCKQLEEVDNSLVWRQHFNAIEINRETGDFSREIWNVVFMSPSTSPGRYVEEIYSGNCKAGRQMVTAPRNKF